MRELDRRRSPKLGRSGDGRCQGVERTLSGWGRYPVASTCVVRPEKLSTLRDVAVGAPTAVLARGKGRSYGDASLNPGGHTILTERLDRMRSFDDKTGLVVAEAGASLADVLATFVPRGWFPPVTPGTKFVSLGGMVAADVHGKNQHRVGTIGAHIGRLRLLTASGDMVHCSALEKSDLFWATVGGMGLTGTIVDVEMRLRKIDTAYINYRVVRADNLEAVVELLDGLGSRYEHSVAWIDCLQAARRRGRGVVMLGDHTASEQLPSALSQQPLSTRQPARIKVPIQAPGFLLNALSMRAFNELYFRLNRDTETIIHYDRFFYPLDFVLDWNRLYGSRGFVQYQCVVPVDGGVRTLAALLERCSGFGSGFLAVLKRFGEQDGWLSFPIAGYTLALDIPIRRGFEEFLQSLDETVLASGGRVYLAKDARLPAAALPKMYPRLSQWLEVKSKVDPTNRWSSALSRRLDLGAA